MPGRPRGSPHPGQHRLPPGDLSLNNDHGNNDEFDELNDGDRDNLQAIILSGACGSGKTYASMVLLRQVTFLILIFITIIIVVIIIIIISVVTIIIIIIIITITSN